MNKFLKITMAILMLLTVLPVCAQSEKTIKRKVAIGRFSNETQYAKELVHDKETAAVWKNIKTMGK